LLWLVSKGRWMGFGDVKLALGMGFLLGVSGGLSALVFGIWIGAAVSVLLLAVLRVLRIRRFASRAGRFTIKGEIPFGPFLVTGTMLVFLTGITLASLVTAL